MFLTLFALKVVISLHYKKRDTLLVLGPNNCVFIHAFSSFNKLSIHIFICNVKMISLI